MAQLVELQKHADDFEKLNTELLFVFREEAEGVEGLKKVQAKHPTRFRLALDRNKERTKVYSPKAMTFNNYVIDSQGVIRGEVDGTLRVRATAEQLLKTLREIEQQSR